MSTDRKSKLRAEDVASATAVGAATRIGAARARRTASAEGAGAGAGRKTADKRPVWPAAILVVVVLAVTLAIMLRFGQ